MGALKAKTSFSDPGRNFQAPAMPFARINEGTVFSLLGKGELSIRTGSEVRFLERFMTRASLGEKVSSFTVATTFNRRRCPSQCLFRDRIPMFMPIFTAQNARVQDSSFGAVY